MPKQIIQVPFNVTNPDLKQFSLDRGEIVTARTNKFWWGFGTGEPVSVELTYKGEVYAIGKANVIESLSVSMFTDELSFWSVFCCAAGFETGEAWCKAFMRFRRGHKPKMIYVIGITDIKERSA